MSKTYPASSAQLMSNLRNFMIGLDPLTFSASNYPPHDIIRTSDNEYVVRLAVAGFSKNDITVEVTDSKLKISGKIAQRQAGDYIWNGISQKEFVKHFELSAHVNVESAKFENGILNIVIRDVMKTPKSTTINID